jgi:hypothetical protein
MISRLRALDSAIPRSQNPYRDTVEIGWSHIAGGKDGNQSTMQESYKHATSGDGWWQCGDAPRIELTEIQLFFYEAGIFSGSGIDSRASRGFFFLHGTWLGGGRVAIRKEPLVPAPVENLIGEYDGEGTMGGTWTSDEGSGSWLIRIFGEMRPVDQDATGAALARMDRAWGLHQKVQGIAATIPSKEGEEGNAMGGKTGRDDSGK